MASHSVKLCPRCGKLMPQVAGRTYCTRCDAEYRRERYERRDWSREYGRRQASEDPKYRKFYKSREWRMTSLQYAVDHGHRCERCGKVGTDVHHVIPIQTEEGWELRFDPENLALLCVSCHNIAHGRAFGGNHGKAEETPGRAGAGQASPHLHG
ncbi:MAG: HNH endonuclease [Adlercreutzia sp.]|nr:HNH endonuclease [Adlercreutzia sp.]